MFSVIIVVYFNVNLWKCNEISVKEFWVNFEFNPLTNNFISYQGVYDKSKIETVDDDDNCKTGYAVGEISRKQLAAGFYR